MTARILAGWVGVFFAAGLYKSGDSSGGRGRL